MAEKLNVKREAIHSVLDIFGMDSAFGEQREYINCNGEQGDDIVKIILSVLLANGKRVVIKILREEDELRKGRAKIERQSAFSEFMRQNGIKTPMRYKAGGKYCHEYIYNGRACNVTVEDWCGLEIAEINAEIAYKIGELMARMHILSLENKCTIGCGTLFSAAYWNDVDAFPRFCDIGQNAKLDQSMVEQIKRLHAEKLRALRAVWHKLPRAAVQGDISINNLVYENGELTVFDYNNAGDEVLISDLVMEGLLTAYEMELPAGVEKCKRAELFPAFLKGYLAKRRLSEQEADAAWIIYTLYNSLWFTKIVYNSDSLEKLIEKENYAAANQLLAQMLADITQSDDGRFKG